MKGNILGEAIDEIIDAQISNRQNIHGAGYGSEETLIKRNPQVLNYLNNRNTWIKLASGISISGSAGEQKLRDLSDTENSYLSEKDIANVKSYGLAKNLVLFNTIQSINDYDPDLPQPYLPRSGVRQNNLFSTSIGKMYGGLGDNSRGLQPVPGITDISIECLNRGSIKKATVNIKAYNKFQFGLIELLYLRLGYIMMLEWGWDKYVDRIENNTPVIENVGSTLIEDIWFTGNIYTQTEVLEQIQTTRLKYKGNYDGFFGKVVNFSWKLNNDNTYDITLNLITLGSVIESLNINIPILTKDVNSNLGTDLLTNWVNNSSKNFPELLNSMENKSYKNYVLADNLKGNTNYPTDFSSDSNKLDLKQKFVRLGHFLRVLENNIIFNIENGGNKFDKELKFDLDEFNNICNYEKNLIPLNPNKVIFSVLMGENIKNSIGKTPFQNFNKDLSDFPIEKNGILYGHLLNVYLNFDFIQKSFDNGKNEKGEVSLFKFLTSLCDGINESTGQCTQIEVVVKEDKTITFIDQNQIKGYDKELPQSNTPLNIYGYNSNGTSNFIKDFNLQTKITPDLLNTITIGATATSQKTENSIPFQNFNKGLNNRFGFKQTQSKPKEEDTSALPLAEEFKKQFKVDLLNPKKTPYNFVSGYKYTYKNITFNVNTFLRSIKSIANLSSPLLPMVISQRLEDAENPSFLSKAFSKYVEAFDKDRNKKIEESRQQALERARGSYQAYLAKSFGGNLDFVDVVDQKIVINSKTGNAYTQDISGSEIDKNNALYFKWNNQDHLSLAQNSFKKYLDKQNNNVFESENVTSSQGFIPLELGLTMDGLSGIKIYNKLNINTKFLPSSYPKSLKFITTNVNHKINKNIWETEIKTISMPLSEIIPSKESSDPPVFGPFIDNNNLPTDSSILSPTPIYLTNLKLNPQSNNARKIAEAYLGKVMTDEEWNNLVAATAAEASPNEKERAYVMAVILNRARSRNTDILTILTQRNQFQAVTGTSVNGRQPSSNFINASQTTANAIFKGVEKYLAEVPKDFKFFTAASAKAYGEGTDITFREKILENGGIIIGGTIFGTKV